MADIFISFIHEDEKVADGVKTFLREKLKIHSEVFLASDKWAIHAGEDWLKRIKEELASAKGGGSTAQQEIDWSSLGQF